MSQSIAAAPVHDELINPQSLMVEGESGSCWGKANPEKVFVVDDEYFTRQGISELLRDAGWDVEAFSSCEEFLTAGQSRPNTCMVLDIHFPGMSGLELLDRMSDEANRTPVIVVSGSAEITEAVQSMKQGALDFIEKPVARDVLVASVKRALGRSRRSEKISQARGYLNDLTARQLQIMGLVLEGQPSKNIAADLGISQRTVESHRASIMHRTGARSLPALAQLIMCNRCALEN